MTAGRFFRTDHYACVFLFRLSLVVLWCVSYANAASPSPLFARGYTVIPEPQSVELTGGDFAFGNGWRVVLDSGVQHDGAAVEVLRDDLALRHGIHVETGTKSGSVATKLRMAISPGSVKIGSATDRDRDKLAEEAYRLDLSPESIAITANAAPGLLYGAETLVQLVRFHNGTNWLPAGRITDWPDLQNRFIYWDDKAHLDRMDVLRDVLRQAAFYKVNGVLIKLNAHFRYASAPAVVEPYALTALEFQQLTDYGLRYHVQLIPYIDGPAHIAWILKHPEFEKLRAFPESNYEICTSNPDSYKLLEGMYQELMDANKGVKYFLLSTDEPYYIGLANNAQCNEADVTKKVGDVGKVLAEFISKTAGYLHDHGRTVIFWGEYPLKPADIPALPPYLINGEVYGPEFDRAFRERGIRQMIFTYTEASEPLFPNYYLLPESEQVNYSGASQADEAHFRPTADRISQAFHEISFWGARKTADMMGVDVCAWGDEGLHPETFWLGFASAAGWIWHPGSPDPAEAKSSFYRLFYGRGATNIDRVYQLMSTQAEFWASSWEWGPSSVRPVLFGNSDGIRPIAPRDQAISLPPLPAGDYLRLNYDWSKENSKLLQLLQKSVADNDELLGLLNRNLGDVQLHAYSLEVFLSIAGLYRQNLQMLQDLGAISASFHSAEAAAAKLNYAAALSGLDDALQLAYVIRAQRNRALQDATTTWYKSWYPRVPEANGRRYLLVLNSVQDYRVDRTLGLKYLIQREFLLPFGDWFTQLQQVRNRYAAAHQLPETSLNFDWQDDASTSLGSSY
jgi:hexosaminidase